MKKHKTQLKICALILVCTLMIGLFPLSMHGIEPSQIQFNGQISAPEGTNLSGIEIMVYNALPVYEEQSNELMQFNETYVFSVYSDSSGAFSFTKPTEFCSMSINLATLPQGYGATQKTIFIIPTNTSATFNICPISDIRTTLNGREVEASFFSENGQQLYAFSAVTPSDMPTLPDAHQSSQIQSDRSALSFVESITSYPYTGTVNVSGISQSYTIPYDLTALPLQGRVDFLYERNVISFEQRAECYYDLAVSNQHSEGESCGTSFYDELWEIASSDEDMDNDLRQKISALFVVPSELSEYTECEEIYVGTSSNPYTFQLYYNPDTASVEAVAKMCDELEAVYQYFITSLGFEKPYTEGNLYRVYLVSDDYFSYEAGVNISLGSGKSYSVMRYSTIGDGSYKAVLSHEYHHAIQRLYGITSTEKWVVEGMATFASLIYAGYSSSSLFGEKLGVYLINIGTSLPLLSNLSDRLAPYGTYIHFLYLYNTFSGWNTIRAMYQNVANGDTIYDAISNIPGISSYQAVLFASMTRCVNPQAFYTQLSSCGARVEGKTYDSPQNITLSVNLLSSSHTSFTPDITSQSCSLYYQVESTSSNGLMFNTVRLRLNDDTTSPTVITRSTQLTRVSFYQELSGEKSRDRFYLSFCNTNLSGSSITVSIQTSDSPIS